MPRTRRAILDALTSLKLTIACLVLLMVLVSSLLSIRRVLVLEPAIVFRG